MNPGRLRLALFAAPAAGLALGITVSGAGVAQMLPPREPAVRNGETVDLADARSGEAQPHGPRFG